MPRLTGELTISSSKKIIADGKYIRGGRFVISGLSEVDGFSSDQLVKGAEAFNQSDGKVYRYSGSAWEKVTINTDDITSGTLGLARGGTGYTTARGVQYMIGNDIEDTSSTAITDEATLVFRRGTPTEADGAFTKKKATALYDYIKSKTDDLYVGIGDSIKVESLTDNNTTKYEGSVGSTSIEISRYEVGTGYHSKRSYINYWGYHISDADGGNSGGLSGGWIDTSYSHGYIKYYVEGTHVFRNYTEYGPIPDYDYGDGNSGYQFLIFPKVGGKLLATNHETGVLNEPISVPSDRYYNNEDQYGINMNNSDIIGLNSIYFGDPADSHDEGLNFATNTTGVYHRLKIANDGYVQLMTNKTKGAEDGTNHILPAIRLMYSSTSGTSVAIPSTTTDTSLVTATPVTVVTSGTSLDNKVVMIEYSPSASTTINRGLCMMRLKTGTAAAMFSQPQVRTDSSKGGLARMSYVFVGLSSDGKSVNFGSKILSPANFNSSGVMEVQPNAFYIYRIYVMEGL